MTISKPFLWGMAMLIISFNALYAADETMNNFDLGIKHLSSQQFEDAVIVLNKAVEANPDCSKCYFVRGYAFAKLNKESEALKDYDKAIELDQNNADIYYYRGKLRMPQLENSRWAIEDFTKCLKLDPKNQYRCYRARAVAYDLNFKSEKALLDYKKAMEFGDIDSTMLFNIGGCYINLGKPEKAIGSLMEAVKLDPDNDSALLSIAKIYSHQNKKEDALKYLELAIQKKGFVAKYGIGKEDSRWDNIRDTKEFQRLLNTINPATKQKGL